MASHVDSEPRIVRVDAEAGAVLINIAAKHASTQNWSFWDARGDVGFAIGQHLCPPYLELRRTEGSGVGMFARRAIAAGEEVLREPPILVADWATLAPGAARACAHAAAKAQTRLKASLAQSAARAAALAGFNPAIGSATSSGDATWCEDELMGLVTEATFVPALAWAKAPPAVRAEVLALYCPIDKAFNSGDGSEPEHSNPVPAPLLQAVALGVSELRKGGWLEPDRVESSADTYDDGERLAAEYGTAFDADLVRICFIALSGFFDCTAADCGGGSGDDSVARGNRGSGATRAAAFRLVSRINHSCLPNCWWSVESGGRLVVRALVGIAAGEEVTHAYFEGERWQARAHRRQALASKFFVCGCARCAVEGWSEELDARDAVMRAAEARNDIRGGGGRHPRLSRQGAPGPGCSPAAAAAAPVAAAAGRSLDSRDPEALVAHCKLRWDSLGPADIAALVEAYKRVSLKVLRETRAAAALWPGSHAGSQAGPLPLRPSQLALLADFHDLLGDLHRVSCFWRGAAAHGLARLALLRRLYPGRPANFTAWIAEAAADALVGCLGTVPLEAFVEPALLPATRAMLALRQRPLPREVLPVPLFPPAAAAAAAAAAADGGSGFAAWGGGSGFAAWAEAAAAGAAEPVHPGIVRAAYAAARAELSIVYGVGIGAGGSGGEVAGPGAVLLHNLDVKIRAIEPHLCV